MSYNTISIEKNNNIMTIAFERNTINREFLKELNSALDNETFDVSVVIFKSNTDKFCMGADFAEIAENSSVNSAINPEELWDLYYKLAFSGFISISCVEGAVNAGGMGIIAASDIVLSSSNAEFSLSEMLFGLIPACVYPFLVRKIGEKNSNYLTIMTRPINAEIAVSYNLVDCCDDNINRSLARILSRIRILDKKTIVRYKKFISELTELSKYKECSIKTNRLVFSDEENISKISNYIKKGVFPWQGE